MNSRNTWIVVLVGLLLVAGISYFSWPRSSENEKVPTVATKVYMLENENEQYRINLEYPELSGLSRGDVAAKINKEIKRNVETLGIAFAADSEDMPAELLANFGKDARNEFEMRYRVAHADADIFSVEFNSTVYSIGAAHPGNFTTTLLYDLDTGSSISFGELFVPNFDFPSFLSLKSREMLSKKLGVSPTDEMLVEGTLPTFENFKSYLLTKEGLVILFDQAQVAPSAAGVQMVTIPFAELEVKLKDEYMLNR